MDLRARLQLARTTCNNTELTTKQKSEIKKLLSMGYSKKAIRYCFSIPYSAFKNL